MKYGAVAQDRAGECQGQLVNSKHLDCFMLLVSNPASPTSPHVGNFPTSKLGFTREVL